MLDEVELVILFFIKDRIQKVIEVSSWNWTLVEGYKSFSYCIGRQNLALVKKPTNVPDFKSKLSLLLVLCVKILYDV